MHATSTHVSASPAWGDATAEPASPGGWRGLLLRLGHRRAVALTTLVSVVASLLLSVAAIVLRGAWDQMVPTIIVSIVVPVLVAPLVSHAAFGLLYDLEKARAELHLAAIRDSLTHAYNRRFFMARLEIEVARARRTGTPLSLMMIDVDHFKAINDTHGHAAGDQVLERLARMLIESVRPYDLVARYGGEEFVALMPGLTLEQAAGAAERVRHAVQTMPLAGGGEAAGLPAGITASLGYSCLGGADDTLAALLDRADRSMYAAKHGGRNRVVGLPPGPGGFID
jgi:diguanylate cyclase (GGDEF)-like protein